MGDFLKDKYVYHTIKSPKSKLFLVFVIGIVVNFAIVESNSYCFISSYPVMNRLIFALFYIVFGWGSVAFGQSNSDTLVISTDSLTNNRISIKEIFLSPNGLDISANAPIQLLGGIGTVKSQILEVTTSAKVRDLIVAESMKLESLGCAAKEPNKKCILATDASGKVHVVTNFNEIYTIG